MERKYRVITFYKDYFQEFFNRQSKKTKAKIIWTLEIIEELKIVPENYLKHIEGAKGLYEIRIQSGHDIFRIFCFFEKGNQIVLINAFRKKTRKTPLKEIEMALKIKSTYEIDI